MEARAKTKQDATKVAIGAGVGGIVGGPLGRKQAVAKGVAIERSTDGATVLLTKGQEV